MQYSRKSPSHPSASSLISEHKPDYCRASLCSVLPLPAPRAGRSHMAGAHTICPMPTEGTGATLESSDDKSQEGTVIQWVGLGLGL